jgi:hypothetical protein
MYYIYPCSLLKCIKYYLGSRKAV